MVAQEQQSFRGTFVMYGIILLELPTLTLISVLYFAGKLGEDGWIPMLVVGTLIPLTFLLLMSITLETRLDTHAFSYRNLPFQRSWKQLPLEQISSISVHKKDGILDYGGIGMRFSRKTKAYIFFADYVIEVEQGGKKLVFSTAKPKEFDAVISNCQTNKP
uniref:hypothetical protein n=1 Tax=Algoriphagus sp. TaxID=1872435 RepID=UPI004048AF92